MAKIDESLELEWVTDEEVTAPAVEEVTPKKTTRAKVEKPEPVVTKVSEPVVIETVDAKTAKQKRDADEIQRLNREFKNRLDKEPKVTYAPPKFYAKVLGTIYPLSVNGHTFVVRFDGKPQKFPASIHAYLIKKLGRILDENIPVNQIDEL